MAKITNADVLYPKQFTDKNGKTIKPGDVLIRRFFSRQREYAGRKRCAIEGLSGRDVIVSDEGGLKCAEKQWVKYHIKWDGACLIADRAECSDFQKITSSELFDENNERIFEGGGFHYLNKCFESQLYEVCND